MKKNIIYIVMILLIINISYSLNVNIEVKESFKKEEIIFFNYTIISDSNQQLIYLPYVRCPNAPPSFLQEKTISLTANQPYKSTYYDISIDDSIEPQTCSAYIEIFEPIRQKIEKNFTIKTNPSFSFDITLDKKIFLLKDTIKIDYNSEVQNPSISTTLIFPDKTSKQITLPYSFNPSQLGTYELEITASKEGYKTITKKEQFGVIEKEANIPYTTPGKITKEKKFPYSLIVILFLLIGIITTFILYRNKIKELLTLAKKHKIQPNELTDLVNYIKNMLGKGYTEEDIKQALKEVGWGIEDIEKGFRRLN